MKYKLWYWIPFALASIILVVEIFINIPGLADIPSIGWLLIGLCFLQGLFFAYKYHDLLWSRPNLVIKGISLKQMPVTHYEHKNDPDLQLFGGTASQSLLYTPMIRSVGDTDSFTAFTETNTIAILKVENKKVNKFKGGPAVKTQAKIYVYDENKRPIMEGINARWSTTESSIEGNPKDPHHYTEIDIPAGAERELCLIAKELFDNNCYIFNQETYNHNILKRDEAKLTIGTYLLKIVVYGENTVEDTESWFTLENPGIGKFHIVEIPASDKKNKSR